MPLFFINIPSFAAGRQYFCIHPICRRPVSVKAIVLDTEDNVSGGGGGMRKSIE